MSRSKIILGKGYELIQQKTVAIVGVGGTGSTVAQLLSRMMPAKLILIDGDIVEDINLERQILYFKEDIGKKKANAAKERLKCFCMIEARAEMLTEENINFEGADLVIDCTDNVETRHVINSYCNRHKLPWIYTGAIENKGAVYFNKVDGACFSCYTSEKKGKKCIEVGVMNSIVSAVGSIAVSVATDYLSSGKIEEDMIRLNLDDKTITKLKIKKNPKCKTCGK